MLQLKNNLNLLIKFCFVNFYYQIEKFVRDIAKKYDKKGKELLDIGAGATPYKKYFKKLKYSTQDIAQNNKRTIDHIGDLNKGLPMIKDSSFDYILSTQVLEHLTNPQRVFEEFNRILKPKGKIFLTTNFIYQIHMIPYDYYRFTKYGLKHLGEASGFIIEHLKSQGGIFQVLSYILTTTPIRLILKNKRTLYHLYLIVFSPLIIFLNLSAYLLDFLDKDKELTINYEVIYKKI